MVCTVFNPTLEIARQEVQEVATDDVVLEKVEDAFEHFSIKYCNIVIVSIVKPKKKLI